MKAEERIKCMEFLARQINDEEIFIGEWLAIGVADGDIKYGDTAPDPGNGEAIMDYIDDRTFADLMDTFLHVMCRAKESGGLYCDGVVSHDYS